MASKCAVISIDRGALPELVEDMKSSILVPYGNEKFLAKAIIRLLKNNLLNKKLAQEGYLKSKKYDISVIGKQYIDYYRNFKK